MSLRWFVYWCALLGGCAALVGWAVGRVPTVQNALLLTGVKALLLGLCLGVVLTLVDVRWNHSGGLLTAIPRVLTGGLVGAVGGFMGGLIGQVLYSRLNMAPVLLVGWSFTGTLIGSAPGAYDLLTRWLSSEEPGSALRKVTNGVLGGLAGGLAGGLCYLGLMSLWVRGFADRAETFWSPSATGFVALGLCIGLMIGLAQVILKDAWLRVESGFRSGRELILSRPNIVIGRAEGSDVALFGDSGVEKQHAKITSRGGRYYVEDLGTPGGTRVNGERIHEPTALSAGDRIDVGRSSLLFGETARRGG